MRGLRGLLVFAVLVVLPWWGLGFLPTPGAGSRVDAEPRGDAAGISDGPIVVELFTSQGCSSCPPADRLLGEIEGLVDGVEVVPLSFHVDYWNYLGWRDPFSSDRWSDRQRRYAKVLPAGRVYTPQLVVAGREHLVGSNPRTVRHALEEAARRTPSGAVDLLVDLDPGKKALEIRVAAEILHDDGVERDLWVAVRQSGLVTPVGRGENARRTLENDFVVRTFDKALSVPGEKGARKERRLRIDIDPEWSLEELGVVAFLQDPRSFGIDAAAWTPVLR